MRLPSAALDDAGLEPILEQLRAFVVARDRDVVPRLARSTWDDRRPGLLGVAGAGELGATLADAPLPARPAHVPVAVGRLAVEGELGERLLRAARPAPLRRRRGIAVDGLDDVYAVPPGLELGRRGPVAVLELDVRAAVASACELGLGTSAHRRLASARLYVARLTKLSLQGYLCFVPTIDDVRSVRALAHPLRLELLDLLRFDGPSTATLLARRTGESSGATSYHLRQLAHYGYIEEAPTEAGRERWWRYRQRRAIVARDGGDDMRLLVAELLSREAHAVDRFLAERSRMAEWDDASFFQSRALRLTVVELEQLRVAIERLLAPYRQADADAPPSGALPVRVMAFGYPLPQEEK
jgi:DNA-binding transcriptional ArsR family regulator